ncbi:MAG: acetyltransferase [Pseudomonadota bacterium]
MLIIGAKGFAKEILQIFWQLNQLTDLCFFDNVSEDLPDKLYDQFKILKDFDQVQDLFEKTDNSFVLGIGDPKTRSNMAQKFTTLGGKLTTLISPKTDIGCFNTFIGTGSTLMTGVVITNDIKLGEGCLINLNCTIGHDVKIGRYTELSPGVHVSGNCSIGEFCTLGTGCVILPKIRIGNNAVVGAGAVVTANVADDHIVVGVPARPIRQ